MTVGRTLFFFLSNVERRLAKSIAKGDIKCFLSLNHSARERCSDMEVVELKQYKKYIMSSTMFGEFSQSLGIREKLQW